MVTFIYYAVHVLLVVSIVVYIIARRNQKRSNASVNTLSEQRMAVQLVHDGIEHILQSMLSISDNHAEHTIQNVAALRADGASIESTSASESFISSPGISTESETLISSPETSTEDDK
jgi:hypothetical protein